MILGIIGLTTTNWMSRMFTTIGRPIWTLIINVAGTIFILIPLAFIGRSLYGYIGILVGVALGQILLGIIALILAKSKMQPDDNF